MPVKVKASVRSRSKQPLTRYAGQWVVFVNKRIVAHDETLTRAMEAVEKKGLKEKASVFKVPRKDEGPFALVLFR